MASLVRLAVLLLALTALSEAARRGRNGGRGGRGGRGGPGCGKHDMPPSMAMDFDLQAAGCLPDDFELDMSACNATAQAAGTGMKGLLECMAESFNLVDDQGLNESAQDELLASVSSDSQWQETQRQHLQLCEMMMSPNMTVSQQGVYFLACWHSLSVLECKRTKMEELGASVDAENGGDVGQALVYLAEGHCFKSLYNEDKKDTFVTCMAETGLDFGELKGGFKYAAAYLSAVQSGDNSVEPPSAEDVAAVGEQLDLLSKTSNCSMQALGEADGNEVNFDVMRANVEDTEGPEWMKQAAVAIVDECSRQEDTTVTGALICWHTSAAYACISVRSHGLALMEPGQRPGRGGGRGRGANPHAHKFRHDDGVMHSMLMT
ncbi:uncharacterized protein LOC119093470 [Pollicipes pollicipes]|uniref:uncharacterized protein LOC119093470 n=1 Tax=Pollicipes pollicipes TaxID=41117 RepID=UPI0018855E41|nr:uncharacterized protein LOC119093470 [Pollicipes pollicipes]